MVIWARSRPVQGASLGLGVIVAAVVFVAAFNAMRVPFDAEILAPANVPPIATLCTAQLESSTPANVSPLFCPDGSINKLAWKRIAGNRPQVMKLGRRATPADVFEAVKLDLSRIPGSLECGAALLSAAYYGWNFHIDPVVGLDLECPILK